MKVLIVHGSWYGTGKTVAEAIAKGLGSEGHTADLVHAKMVGGKEIESYEAFIIGSPTHAGGPTFKVGSAIKHIAKRAQGKPFIAFTTYMTPNQRTVEKIEKKATDKGLRRLMHGKAFKVKTSKGGLEDSGLAEAEAFGREMGKALKA
jgi:menaquinone-dependent protoporphyrinogen IX oxidase